MTLRKTAGLLAVFGLALGLIGGNVGAAFTDQVTAQENINVGTFSCVIWDATTGAVIAGDEKSVVYNAPTIMSSAAGSAPFWFDVKNTGTIPMYLHVTGVVSGTANTPFSSILTLPATFGPIASTLTQTVSGGLQWTVLGGAQLGQAYTIDYTIDCNDTGVF